MRSRIFPGGAELGPCSANLPFEALESQAPTPSSHRSSALPSPQYLTVALTCSATQANIIYLGSGLQHCHHIISGALQSVYRTRLRHSFTRPHLANPGLPRPPTAMPSATGSSWEKYTKKFADDEVEEKKITPLTDEYVYGETSHAHTNDQGISKYSRHMAQHLMARR